VYGPGPKVEALRGSRVKVDGLGVGVYSVSRVERAELILPS